MTADEIMDLVRMLASANTTLWKEEVLPGVIVSTVSLAWPDGPDEDMFFETMVFGGPHHHEWVEQYRAQDEAQAGHARMCQRLRDEVGND